MLEHWLTQASPPPSWTILIQALKYPVINRRDIASNIEAMLGHTVCTSGIGIYNITGI